MILVAFALLLAGLNWYCGSGTVREQQEPAMRKAYAGLTEGATYVGMTTCTGCHAGIHETFRHTGMGLSFDTASREKSSAVFNETSVVNDPYKNLSYHAYWRNNELRFLEFRRNGKDTVHRREEKVACIVGSGQHTNSHMWVSNGYYFQAPMTFYTQQQKWDLPPGFEKGENSRFSRMIGLECMTCHNGYPEFVLGSENKYTQVKNGIDCERCHGPGSIHVKEKSQGILIDTSKYIDYSIVNPSKLPIDLQFDVCQRCHIQGNSVLKEGKSYLDFKPGMRLSEVMDVYMPVYDNNASTHIMASHAERLKMSKCFQVTNARIKAMTPEQAGLKPYKNGLTCITCHNPHISVKVTGSSVFNRTCEGCHTGAKEPVCSNDPLLNKKAKNDCVSCHMPPNSATDIPHVTVHDHRIGMHAPRKGTVKQVLKGIAAINNPHPDAASVAQAYINYVEKFGMEMSLLDSAEKYLNIKSEQDKLRHLHALVQIAHLRKDLNGMLQLSRLTGIRERLNSRSYDNKDAWTAYRIGEACNSGGQPQQALYWFGKAHDLAPYSAEFANKYGTALAGTGDLRNAERIFRNLVKEHPEYAPGLCNLGYLYLSRDRNISEAARLLDRSLALDPDYELALLNRAMVCALEGNNKESRTYIQRVLRVNPQNIQAQQALKKLSAG